MADEPTTEGTTAEETKSHDIWIPAIVITTVNAALFFALFAGIAGR
jgi:hypothetical protein